jgi:hypothetical protein
MKPEAQTGFSDKRLGGASTRETREMIRDAPLVAPTAQQSAVPDPIQLPGLAAQELHAISRLDDPGVVSWPRRNRDWLVVPFVMLLAMILLWFFGSLMLFGPPVSVKTNGSTTTCMYQWWHTLIWTVFGLGLLGFAIYGLRRRDLRAIVPTIMGLVFLEGVPQGQAACLLPPDL